MTSDAQRKATAAFLAKRKALGYRKVTVWLPPEAVFKLDALKASTGSKDKAVGAAIMAWDGSVPETPKKPSAARKPALAKVSKPKVGPGIALAFGYTRPKPGERQKKPKGK